MTDHDEQRLRQLAAEQAAAAPSPHDWIDVEHRRAPGRSSQLPAARLWLAAAATLVVVGVVGVIVLAVARVADAPSSVSTADPTSPSVPQPATSATATTIEDDPNVSVVGSAVSGVSVPHRVLVDGASVGPTWTTTVATNAAQFVAMWANLGLVDTAEYAEIRDVDFATSVVVHFGPAESGSCRFGPLADVRYDADSGYLFPDLPFEDPLLDCTDDANPHTVMVAIDRADLPSDAFTVWVENARPPGCCINEVTQVAAGELSEAPPTTVAPPVATTQPPGNPFENQITIPSGQLEVGNLDLFVAHVDGDLWLHPDVLGDTPGAPLRVADLGDPREPVTEGEGPNQVEQVAGVFDGAVLYSDCCEPVSGNLLAAIGPDSERIVWGASYTPVFSPDRSQVAAANQYGLTVVDLEEGISRSRTLNDGTTAFMNVWDVAWTADGRSVVLLVSDDASYSLQRFDAATPFVADPSVSIGIDFDGGRVTNAGRRTDGAIAVAITDGPATPVLRFYDPSTFAELPGRVDLPAEATAVQWCDDDRLLWVEGDQLWFQSTSAPPRPLGNGYRAAWCAN